VHLTVIVTIDPVKTIGNLDVLVHSLNLQTTRAFDVVFYNQTPLTDSDILDQLTVRPTFPFRFLGVPAEDFLGAYPIWDLYAVHAALLDSGRVGYDLMSVHMEEFFDADYVEQLLAVLGDSGLDILFGNMVNTRATRADVSSLLEATSAEEFDRQLRALGLHAAPHWGFDHRPVLWSKDPRMLADRAERWFHFRFRKTLPPTQSGFTQLGKYVAEDVYAIKTAFARRYNWFLSGHHLYFEDIHIFRHPAVGDLSAPLRALTRFPAYFNLRRIYHLRHERFYFQLEDETFTSLLLERQVDDPVLQAHQAAIRRFRRGEFSLHQALTYTRRNPDGTGTQDLNFAYHMKYLSAARARGGS